MKAYNSVRIRDTCTRCYERQHKPSYRRSFSKTKEIDFSSTQQNINSQIFSNTHNNSIGQFGADLFDPRLSTLDQSKNSTIDTNNQKYYDPNWKFDKAPRNFWSNETNQRKYFDWLGERIGINQLDDWYHVEGKLLKKSGGYTLLVKHFQGSLSYALRQLYPEHNWIPWKFDIVPKGIWNDPEQRLSFFLWLEKELQLKQKDDWYHVSVETVGRNGGAGLMSHYFSNSMYKAMKSVFPEHNWIPWKFLQTPKHCWDDIGNVRMAMEDAASKLHVQTLDDWYRVSLDQLRPLGVSSIVVKYKGLPNVLKLLYPEHNWQLLKFTSGLKKSAQRWLKLKVEELFPNHEIIEDFMTEFEFPSTKKPISLDIYIPSEKLAFEYQGEQHYQELSYFAPQRHYRLRDFEKRTSCEKAGITLIEVPFWWDRSVESIAATVRQHRNDIVFSNPSLNLGTMASVIPSTPPAAFNKRSKTLLMDAIQWKEELLPNPEGWWMSSSCDGIRAMWDGQKLLSNNGKVIRAPSSFLNGLPHDLQLDGELSLKNGDRIDLMHIVKSDKEPKWANMEFRVLDIVSEEPAEARMEILYTLTFPSPAITVVLPTRCEGLDHMKEYLNDCVANGSSSILLRKPHSNNEQGSLFKVKNFGQQQVTVIRVAPEQKGILCKQNNGIHCVVRADGQTLLNPPAESSVITVQYDGFHRSGRLRNAVLV